METFEEAYCRKMREYYHANKDRIRQQQKEYEKSKVVEKHECECGGRYTTKNKPKHEQSNKHIAFIANKKG